MKKGHERDEMRSEYDFSDAVRGRYAGRFYLDPQTAEGSMVVLRRSVPEHGLYEGDVGTIVHPYREDRGFVVEFVFGSGEPAAVLTLQPADLRLLEATEILHARRVQQAGS